MRLFMIVAGLAILGMTVVSLTKRHMTEIFCIAWGIVAVLFICAGIILRPTVWSNYISWGGLLLVLFGVALMVMGAFFISLRISKLAREVKELAIQISLLNQENTMILRDLSELPEESDMVEYETEALVRN